jgi:hypothetical protein
MLYWFGRSRLYSSADGLVLATNNATADLTGLILGSNDTSGIRFAKSGTTLSVTLGGGTGWAKVQQRSQPRTGTTTSSATPTINTDNVDKYYITAQTVDITSMTYTQPES